MRLFLNVIHLLFTMRTSVDPRIVDESAPSNGPIAIGANRDRSQLLNPEFPRRTAKSPTYVAGFARIQRITGNLNSWESSYTGKLDFAAHLEHPAACLDRL